MKGMVLYTLTVFIGLLLATVNACSVMAQAKEKQVRTAKPEKQVVEIRIGYLRAYATQLTLSVLDLPPRDEGVAGANVAIGDNNTTGNFLDQKFTLDGSELKPDAEAYVALGPANRVADVNTETYEVEKHVLVGQRVCQLALTPDQKTVIGTNGVSNDITFIPGRYDPFPCLICSDGVFSRDTRLSRVAVAS